MRLFRKSFAYTNRTYQQPYRENMSSSSDQLRIVLIGKTGNGKSSTGNSLLDTRTAFHATQLARSITRDCQAKTGQYTDSAGREKQILVVDTPGFFDTDESISNQMVEKKIASEIFQMTSPGVHAFLIVLCIGRFSPEEKHTVDFIKTIFGTGAAKYCIVVFTHEEQLEAGQTLDDFISESELPALEELITICGNRKLAISNKLAGQPLVKKTQQLLRMIQEMVNKNNGTYYTNAEYQRIEQQRREEQRRREEAELARKKAYEESLIAKTREEERRRADELAQKAREEERRKAEKRIKEAEEEAKRQKEQREREERARKDAEEARRQVEERARRDAEEARRQTEERARRDAEDARRQIEERARRDAEEARRQAEEQARRYAEMARIQSARNESQSSYCYPRPACHDNSGDGYNALNSLFGQMAIRSAMGSGTPMTSMNTGMSTPARSSSGGMSDIYGGRFTGGTMATRGAANGRPIIKGPDGGFYHLTPSGNRSYLRK